MRPVIEAVIRFRNLILAAAAGVMVAGALLIPQTHADVLPETSPVTVEVQTEALGLSAAEVESLVTVPMEKNLFEGVMGVTDTTSDSVPGLSDIELHFAPGTDLYQARQLVQERLNSAFTLPNVSAPPVMLQPVSSTSNVMLVGLTSRTQSLIDMSVLARWTIVPKLLGLAGVANVSTYGQADHQLQVLVDPAKLAAHHTTVQNVIATVGNAQLITPISYLQGSTPGTGGFLEGSNQRITIQPVLPYGTPSNVANLPVSGAPSGTRVKDVADVVASHQPLIGDAEVNGQPGLVLQIQKLPSASVPAITKEVNQALAQLSPSLRGIQVNTSLFRPGTYVSTAFGTLRLALIIAAALLVVALLALLAGLRPAFVSAAAVAVSLASALLVLDLFGYSVNALMLLGLLLAAGVVVSEAAGDGYELANALRAARGRGDGWSATAREAVIQLGAQSRGPLLAAFGCVAATAIPLLVASGVSAAFLFPMALAFVAAVTASMIVAIVLTPALSSALAAFGPGPAPAARVASVRHRIAAGYAKSLDIVRGAPRALLPAVCAAAAAAVIAGLFFVRLSQPSFADRDLVVRWTGPPGMSLTELDRVSAVATSELRALPGVQDVGATLGRATTSDQIVNTNSGELWVTMKPDADYARTLASVRAIADGTPGISGTVSTYESDSMAGALTASPDQVVTRVYGTSYPELESVAARVRAAVARVRGVKSTQVQSPTVQPTLEVEVNLDAAERAGLTPGDIRRETGILTSGLIVGNFFEDQKVFDVVVWGTPDVRDSVQSLDSLMIDTNTGGHVRLGSVASVTVAPEPAEYKHDNTSLYLDVTASVRGRSAAAVSGDITSRLKSVPFPAGYYAQAAPAGQGSPAAGTSRFEFLSIVLAALLAIILFAQAALGGWRRGLASLGAVPAAIAGGAIVLFAAGYTDSLGAIIGLAGVFALAVHAAITVPARIRAGQNGHLDRGQAAAQAAASSAGRVVTSAVVAAAVLAPFAVLNGAPGMELLGPAAQVMLGGLASLTLVSLFVLPSAAMASRAPVRPDDSSLAGPPAPGEQGPEEPAPGEQAPQAQAPEEQVPEETAPLVPDLDPSI